MSVLAQHVAAVLLHHVRTQGGAKLSLFESDIRVLLSGGYDIACPPGLISDALAVLIDIGGCRNLPSPLTGTFCRLDWNGANYYYGNWPSFSNEWGDDDEADHAYSVRRQEIQKKYPVLETYFELENAWIERILSTLSEMDLAFHYYEQDALLAEAAIPASDRIVALDDNQRAELIHPLEQISKEIQTSNSTRNELGEEADRISAEIDAGIDLAKAGRVRLSAIIAVLIKPLKFIAERFSGAAIGTLATELIKALLKLL
ncbi:MAG: hypothetical protein WBR13_08855 [Allosphingosinicella sp.]